ncbi:MAG: glycosyltransferase family 1 protein [Proteobacteria bacterium]|nr:glycosyltransferase family 1 protein [Pseudomonadota bacterium]
MKIAIVTDAWRPQTNGVVTTLTEVMARVERQGHRVRVFEPGQFFTLPLPAYREVKVAPLPYGLGGALEGFAPDALHIATEGPLGLAARRWALRRRFPFTTSLHTKFPEYLHERTRFPLALGYGFLRWFHSAAQSTLVTTETQKRELGDWGLRNLRVWGRGVALEAFPFVPRPRVSAAPRLLYVGRVAVEKNLPAFLDLPYPGEKVVVGDGPARAQLQARYPHVQFLGYRYGAALAEAYGSADVFVFPSKTDTFGLVILEALATGTPVAAYPVAGPIDILQDGVTGALHNDLAVAVERALACDRMACRRYAESQSWDQIAERFLEDLVPLPTGAELGRA